MEKNNNQTASSSSSKHSYATDLELAAILEQPNPWSQKPCPLVSRRFLCYYNHIPLWKGPSCPLSDTINVSVNPKGLTITVYKDCDDLRAKFPPLVLPFSELHSFKLYKRNDRNFRFTFRPTADLSAFAAVQSVVASRKLYLSVVRKEERTELLQALDDLRVFYDGTPEEPIKSKDGYVLAFKEAVHLGTSVKYRVQSLAETTGKESDKKSGGNKKKKVNKKSAVLSEEDKLEAFFRGEEA